MPGPTNDELKDLNEELEKAGISPLGDDDDEGDAGAADDVSAAEPEVIPTLSEMEEEGEEEGDDKSGDEDEEEPAASAEDEDEETSDDEPGEGEEGLEPETPAQHRQRYVPYSQYKSEKDALQEQRDFWKNAAEGKTGGKEKDGTADTGPDPLEEAVTKLATELNLDPAKSKTLLTTIVDLAKKQALPKDVMDRLAKSEQRDQERETRDRMEAERSYFDNEWQGFTPFLQQKYPNATPQQLALAKQAMDIVSHAPRFAKIPDLEYIFTKTEKEFENILFSPKKKTLERGRTGGTFDDNTERRERQAPDIGAEDPESMKALEDSLYDENEDQGLTFFDPEGNKMKS